MPDAGFAGGVFLWLGAIESLGNAQDVSNGRISPQTPTWQIALKFCIARAVSASGVSAERAKTLISHRRRHRSVLDGITAGS